MFKELNMILLLHVLSYFHHKLVNSTELYGGLKFEVESNGPELHDSKYRYAIYVCSAKSYYRRLCLKGEKDNAQHPNFL